MVILIGVLGGAIRNLGWDPNLRSPAKCGDPGGGQGCHAVLYAGAATQNGFLNHSVIPVKHSFLVETLGCGNK